MTEKELKIEQKLRNEASEFLATFDKNGAWAPLYLVMHIIHLGNWGMMSIHRGQIDYDNQKRWLYCSNEPASEEEFQGEEIDRKYLMQYEKELMNSDDWLETLESKQCQFDDDDDFEEDFLYETSICKDSDNNICCSLQEAIQLRHSVRKYIDKPIPQDIIDILQAKIEECNNRGNLHIQLVTNEPKAFKGKMAYGTFSGVTNYFAMVGKKAYDLSERIGYYGEQLVLLAQTLGLNTCWVGLTYNKVKEAYSVDAGEKLCCMIALGYGDDPGRNVKHKTVEQVSNASDITPAWFKKGVEAALLAPTAVNQQKFSFEYVGMKDNRHIVKANKGFSLIGYTRMDLGIVKCHFEIAVGKEIFVWG